MSIKRNTFYNLGGAVAPLVLTLVTVPLYLQAIGEARYGVLALVWLLLGYFGMFDLGLSAATANALARGRATDPAGQGRIFMTSLLTNAGLGIAIAAALLLLLPPILDRMDSVSPSLRAELFAALPWLAASIPLVTIGGVLGGVLGAYERFGVTNLVGIGGTALFQLVPLWAAYTLGTDLGTIIPAAVVARAIPIVVVGILAFRQIPITGARFNRATLRALLVYGGWVMVTNLVGPILVSADQFVIGALLGASAVAQYAVAYSLAIRMQILPSALVRTIFPRLSRVDGAEALALSGQALRSVMIVMTMLCVPAILLARPFLGWWIDRDFASAAAPVAEILLISVWINGLAIIPFALLQAQRRPDIVAKFHLAEIPPFFVMLFLGIHWFGLPGAALAWALRIVMDTVLLFWASRLPAHHFSRVPIAGGALMAAWAVAQSQWLSNAELFAVAVAGGAALAAWGYGSDPALRRLTATVTRRLGWT